MSTTQNHSERPHALLSASKANQWINCPQSARLQEGIPDVQTEDSKRGTLAHELAEVKLRFCLLLCNDKQQQELNNKLAEIKTNPLYDHEMEETISEYARIVEERYMEAKARSSDAVVLLEEQLDFSEWVLEGYGTCDVVLIADGVLEVIDLKYGKGVPVSAEDNPQIRLYALGSWSGYNYLYLINEVRMTIIQPRLDSISTATKEIGDLLNWAETVVKPAAQLAWEGKGEFKVGDWCRWCKVKATCRARAEANMAALQHEFRDPALMSDEEIGSILFIADQLIAWSKDVQNYAFECAKTGHRIPQWKLVAGKSNRIITDKGAARKKLDATELDDEKYLKPQELFGIGDLEKNIGKKELAALIGDLIVKPPGKPTLVPETDKRPEINSVESDFSTESFEAD